MLPLLIRYITFPLRQYLTKRSALQALKRFRESQWWPEERLRSFQEEKLKVLLTHASKNVPYYRDLFERERLDPVSAAGREWSRMPVLRKEIVREHFERLQAVDRKRLFILGASSGSSG